MKKILLIVMCFIFVYVLTACGTEVSNDVTNEDSSSSIVLTQPVNSTEQVIASESEDAKLTFILTAGEAGEYGKLITYNKDTEFEETFYAYYVPSGTYTVTNQGEYMSQVNVYGNEMVITDGWEEPELVVDGVKLLDVGESYTITVEENQHIEIAEPSVFEFKLQ